MIIIITIRRGVQRITANYKNSSTISLRGYFFACVWRAAYARTSRNNLPYSQRFWRRVVNQLDLVVPFLLLSFHLQKVLKRRNSPLCCPSSGLRLFFIWTIFRDDYSRPHVFHSTIRSTSIKHILLEKLMWLTWTSWRQQQPADT